ncbi:MAG: 50S ribosomal protein L10 [Candidatus Pacebacteria bacterium]|nr:50S ribosomal protein L10 [Candidatus Paceibacterota bacterium]QQR76780.1 MAG: 50S ribosomal protein L10 [Candidatus Nomurabacteria bacterium]
MAITKQKKQEITKDFTDLIKDAKSLVFVKFNKLTVSDVNSMRRGFQKENVGYKVIKKTLMKRVLGEKGITGDMPELPGEVAIAFGVDSLAPAREVYNFHTTHKDNVEIVGGVYEGEYKTKEEMTVLATIPGMEQLRGMFANIINSPLQRFAVLVNEYAKTK